VLIALVIGCLLGAPRLAPAAEVTIGVTPIVDRGHVPKAMLAHAQTAVQEALSRNAGTTIVSMARQRSTNHDDIAVALSACRSNIPCIAKLGQSAGADAVLLAQLAPEAGEFVLQFLAVSAASSTIIGHASVKFRNEKDLDSRLFEPLSSLCAAVQAKTAPGLATKSSLPPPNAAQEAAAPAATPSESRRWVSIFDETDRSGGWQWRPAIGAMVGPVVNAAKISLGMGIAMELFASWRWIEVGAGYVYPNTFNGTVRLWGLRRPIEAGLVVRYSAYKLMGAGSAGELGQGIGAGVSVGYAFPLPVWKASAAGIRLEYVYSHGRTSFGESAGADPITLAAFCRFGG